MKSNLIIIYLFTLSFIFGQETNIFTLCEGNFGFANSSLWSFDDSFEDVSGPIHWNQNSSPLGDVGQSLTVHNQKLFIIMNNSHTIEVMSLETSPPTYERTISLPNASPRYLTVADEKGYISAWNLNALIVLDLNNMEIIDTIQVNGIPEMIINYQNNLYISIPNKSDWSSNNKILKVDQFSHLVVDSFSVAPGPSSMTLMDSTLYIACSSYDNDWNQYIATSSVNLVTNEVKIYDAGLSSNYGSDIFNYQGNVYQVFDGGVVLLNNDLSPDIDSKLGNYGSLYSASAYGEYLYLGISDYTAPDTVLVLNSSGIIVKDYIVGAIPGAFGFSIQNQLKIDESTFLPTVSSLKSYPNPFNPVTNIEISITGIDPVRLYIVNIQGQIIEEIPVSSFKKRIHNISWNASSLSSGLYFAVFEQGNNTAVKKLSLIK